MLSFSFRSPKILSFRKYFDEPEPNLAMESDTSGIIHYFLGRADSFFFVLFDSLRPLNNLSVMRDGSSWVEPVLVLS